MRSEVFGNGFWREALVPARHSRTSFTSSVKSGFGHTGGGFDFGLGFDADEETLARLMLTSRGAINRVLSGPIENEEITLDGTALVNAQVTGCTVKVSRGDFALIGNTIANCRFNFSGEAENVRQLLMMLEEGNTNDGS